MPIRARRSTVSALIAAVTTALSLVGLSQTSAQAATSQFSPGQTWNDTSGTALQMHGLGIVKVGSTWYGFGEDKTGENSGNAAFQDIPCYSSTDLSHWTLQGKALTRQTSGDLGPNRVVERPKVLFNASTNTFVMYMHIDSASYGEAKVGVATSSTPCGPYSYRGSFQPLGRQSRDIGLFQDTDGTGYLLSEDRASGLRVDKLSADYLSVVSAGGSGGSVALFADYEAPAMVKTNGTYFVLGSHLTGWNLNDNVYATATSLSGSWSSFKDFAPAGTNTYQTQTANIIPVSGSAGTSYIYAGDRWNPNNLGGSQLVWLPLTLSGTTANVGWQNSWSLDVAAGTWSGSSNPASGSTHHLTNANSSMVMDVSGGSTASGGAVIQWAGHGGTNQQWTLHQVAGNVYTLTNQNSGLCLEVPNRSTATGTALDQWTCGGGSNQQWALDPVGSYTSSSDASYELTNLNSGLVADVSGGSTAQGAQVIQWTTNGQANQTWTLS
ncbi:Ricin B lectin [Catenulispora acidiphila DSM 44928]|uniref:Ricin B lectin n=1 Tax=Catenulispora acidiphila (strain DSM 44928 / JCM 14897 / NBRC 102108 / NRRL B-24433 / ID139908) TaxID=479433 RepID=C7Q328_CATAD|nr:RICIN domain-containing protein [Catenulispora acidiphila]ACU73764.1 Ricin B lectin [Catenulispora acidiphila DSM 44928]